MSFNGASEPAVEKGPGPASRQASALKQPSSGAAAAPPEAAASEQLPMQGHAAVQVKAAAAAAPPSPSATAAAEAVAAAAKRPAAAPSPLAAAASGPQDAGVGVRDKGAQPPAPPAAAGAAAGAAVAAAAKDAWRTQPQTDPRHIIPMADALDMEVCTADLVPGETEADKVQLRLQPLGLLGVGGMSVVLRVQVLQMNGDPSRHIFVSSVQGAADGAASAASSSSSGGGNTGESRTFALKIMKRHSDFPSKERPSPVFWAADSYDQIMDEWRVVTACQDSKCVIKGHAVGLVTVCGGEQQPCVLLDVAEGGSLQSYVDQNGALSHQQAWDVMQRVAKGLQDVHSMALYVHGDLKLENILLARKDALGSAVLADFGLSKHLPHPRVACRRQIHTPGYQTPDVQPGRSHGAALDVFLLGLLLVHMLSGSTPFSYVPGNLNQREVSRRTPQELDNPDCPYVRDNIFTPAEKDFLQQAFVTDPALRLTLDEIQISMYMVLGPDVPC